MYSRQEASRGFTLIELLVVIAIIAILAAILFPVFARAREKARQTTCLNNQKQLVTAALMYAQDHEETFPAAASVWGDLALDKKVLICPSAGAKVANGYVYSNRVAGQAQGDLDNPTGTALTADGSKKGATLDAGLVPPQPTVDNVMYDGSELEFRHSKKFIAGFVDGHVEATLFAGLLAWDQPFASTTLPGAGDGWTYSITAPTTVQTSEVTTGDNALEIKVTTEATTTANWTLPKTIAGNFRLEYDMYLGDNTSYRAKGDYLSLYSNTDRFTWGYPTPEYFYIAKKGSTVGAMDNGFSTAGLLALAANVWTHVTFTRTGANNTTIALTIARKDGSQTKSWGNTLDDKRSLPVTQLRVGACNYTCRYDNIRFYR
jgi:prepilin-type N-terminal cleavage/methylation domain-containing protein/prepilin-type processing-associated H-X9-DG protein